MSDILMSFGEPNPIWGTRRGGTPKWESNRETQTGLEGPPTTDLELAEGDLTVDTSLKTAIVLSLFTDARALPDDPLPTGDDPRGWWGDMLSSYENDRLGSRLWLLGREKQTPETLERAKEYAEEALAWLLEDGIAEAVTVDAEWADPDTHPRGMLALRVIIQRPHAPALSYEFNHLFDSQLGVPPNPFWGTRRGGTPKMKSNQTSGVPQMGLEDTHALPET